MDVPVYTMSGASAGTMSVDEIALGETVNADLIKQAFVMYHANKRQGSARSKTRSMGALTGKKLYKQKGTGNARHGDKKAPTFRGGGHAQAKRRTREDYRKSMPVKMRRKANRNALLAKLVDQEVKVIDGLSFDAPRTKDFIKFLGAIGIDKSALLALNTSTEGGKNVSMSARNVDGLEMCKADQLNVYEMLNNRYLIIDKADLEAWLSGPSSQTGKIVKNEEVA